MRDDRGVQIGWKSFGRLNVGDTPTHYHYHTVFHELGGLGRDRNLLRRQITLPVGVTGDGGGGRQRPSMHALEQAFCRQVAQVAPDRVYRYPQFITQLGHFDSPIPL
jgi:hypothetical protein